MPPPRMSDEERAAWDKAHKTQVDSALAQVDAADHALDDEDDAAPAAEAVHLDQTQCSFVFFRRGGSAATAYGIWRCANAREADAIAEQRSHVGFATRSYTMLGISRAAVRQQAQLLAAMARKKGKVAASAGGGEGPRDGAGAARSSPARSREGDEASDGGDGVEDDAFASPQRKKQKKAPGKDQRVTTPAADALFTPAPAEAPAPASAPHLAAMAVHTAAQPPAAALPAAAPCYADAKRVEDLEAQLKEAQRKLTRMTRRFEALKQAQEAQRADFESIRAGLGAALAAAVAACVTSAALDVAPGAA